MRNLIIFLFLISVVAYGAIISVDPNNHLKLGDGSTSEKKIELNTGLGTNPTISSTDGTDLIFNVESFFKANDLTVGDGAGSDKKLYFDIGAGASNPYFSWSNTLQKLVFNNGLVEKAIGSGSGSGAGGGENLLPNSGFEDPGSPILNWTATGGTLTQEDYTNGTDNNGKYARFVTTSLTDKLESDLVTIPDYFEFAGQYDVWYKATEPFKMSIVTNTGTVTATATVQPSTDWVKAPVEPNTWDVDAKLVFEPTVASSTLEFDNAYLGSNKGITNDLLKAETVEVILPTDIGAGVQEIPQLQISGLEVGARYKIGGTVRFTNSGGSGNSIQIEFRSQASGAGDMYFAKNLYDPGTSPSVPISLSSEFTATSNILHVRKSSDAGTLSGNGTLNQTYIQLTKIASQKVTSFTPEQANFFVRARFFSVSGNISVGASGVPVQYSQGTNLRIESKNGSMKQTCTGTNSPVGDNTACTAGENSYGLVINAPRTGRYKVCAQGNIQIGSSGGWRIAKTLSSDSTIIEQSVEYQGGNGESPSHICSHFNVDSVGEVAFRVFHESNAGSSMLIDGDVSVYERDASMTIEMVEHNVSAPRIINQVTTGYKKGIRTEYCRINNSGGTVTLDTNSGLCETWIDSFTSSEITFKEGIFSRPPVCLCSVKELYFMCSTKDETTSKMNYERSYYSGSTSGQYTGWTISCTGAR